MEKYRVTIGLEVHAHIKTVSKIFCGCSTEFGAEPNTHTCPVCMGMPGVLPVLNKKVVEYGIRAAIATNCSVAPYSIFARKNYFYPDLPKNYQVSQYEKPLAENGFIEVTVEGEKKKIEILRIHLEEDAGKSIHDMCEGSLVDFNRTGTPLMEIVTTPCISSLAETQEYLKTLKSILQYLGVSDCDMEKGSLRCDANISVKPAGEEGLGVKTEVKNMNSFKGIQRALEYESERQIEVLEGGGKIHQETRLWDEKAEKTFSMRSKEEAHDYRYFPEPDLVPIVVSEKWKEEVLKTLPELPRARRKRFINNYGLSDYDSKILTAEKALADYYEDCLKKVKDVSGDKKFCKTVANWIMGDLMGHLNEENKSVEESPVSPEMLVDMIELINKGTISGKIAKTVFDDMYKTGKAPADIIKEKNLVQVSDEGEIIKIIKEVIGENPASVESYRKGKEKAIGFLIGQVMKKSKGKANPAVVNRILKEQLK